MYTELFEEFITSKDTLRVYEGNELVFSSGKDRLIPMLEYNDSYKYKHADTVIFDKILGNAAALLAVRVGCREIYSPLGSQLAIQTMEKYNIKHHLVRIVPYIQQPNRADMCPMEKMSINKRPDEFYDLLKTLQTG